MRPVNERLLWGGGHDIDGVPWSRELMETLDMYIFLKSSAKGLSRGTHFSYASSSQLGASCDRSLRLPECDYKSEQNDRVWGVSRGFKALLSSNCHPKTLWWWQMEHWVEMVSCKCHYQLKSPLDAQSLKSVEMNQIHVRFWSNRIRFEKIW